MTKDKGDLHFEYRARHSMLRARERYGLNLDKYALAEFRKRIQLQEPDSGCVFLSRDSRSPSVKRWAIWYKGEWVPVVYDEAMAAIVTVLPADCLRRFKQKLPW